MENNKKNKMKKVFTNFNVIIVSTLLFLVWILFFDTNSVRQLQIVKKDISELETQRDFYKAKIKEDSLVIENINNKEFVEKYAREKFLMKHNDETMFVVVPDSESDLH